MNQLNRDKLVKYTGAVYPRANAYRVANFVHLFSAESGSVRHGLIEGALMFASADDAEAIDSMCAKVLADETAQEAG